MKQVLAIGGILYLAGILALIISVVYSSKWNGKIYAATVVHAMPDYLMLDGQEVERMKRLSEESDRLHKLHRRFARVSVALMLLSMVAFVASGATR